jgi:HEAT repeat protein
MTLVLLLSLFVQETKPEDAAAAEALEKFKTEYKAKEASARATAVSSLASTFHDKTWARMGQVLVADAPEVRIAAAKGFALAAAAENRKKPIQLLLAGVGPNQKEPSVIAAIYESLGKLKDATALPPLEAALKSRDVVILKSAAEAVGSIGARSSVPALIDCMKWLEAGAQEAPSLNGGGQYGNLPGVGGGGVTDEGGRERERTVKPVVQKALGAITKVSHSSGKEWETWWRQNGGAFLRGK